MGVSESGECSDAAITGACVISSIGAMVDRKLSSDEWRLLIAGPGQHFSGGAEEFRRALIKYFVHMGFEFVFFFFQNGTTRVIVACWFRAEKGCPWRMGLIEPFV